MSRFPNPFAVTSTINGRQVIGDVPWPAEETSP